MILMCYRILAVLQCPKVEIDLVSVYNWISSASASYPRIWAVSLADVVLMDLFI